MGNVIQRVTEVLQEKVKNINITPDTNFKEMGLDSLDIISLLLDLEDEFNIHFESSEVKDFVKVKDLFDAIEKKLHK